MQFLDRRRGPLNTGKVGADLDLARTDLTDSLLGLVGFLGKLLQGLFHSLDATDTPRPIDEKLKMRVSLCHVDGASGLLDLLPRRSPGTVPAGNWSSAFIRLVLMFGSTPEPEASGEAAAAVALAETALCLR